MTTKDVTTNDLWADKHFGSRLDRDVMEAQDAERRKRHGGVDSPDIAFSRLAIDTPGSLRNAIGRLVRSNDSEVNATLRQTGIKIDGDSKMTVHAPDGRAITVDLLFRDGEWRCNFPMRTNNGIEWRLLVAQSKKGLMELVLRASRVNTPSIRELTPGENLAAARLCAAGKLDDALILYVRARCGDVNVGMLDDPKYRPITDAAAWFVFRHSTNDFADSKDAQDFMNRFIGERPTTVPLLRAAHAAWKDQQQRDCNRRVDLNLSQPAPAPAPTEEQIEELSDKEVNRLFSGIRRERAQSR